MPTSVAGRLVIGAISTALVAVAVAIPIHAKVNHVRFDAAAAAAVAVHQSVTSQPKEAVAAKKLTVPEALFKPGLSLRAKPVSVPLRLEIPSIKVSAPMVGVGVTSKNVMDAPEGPPNDPSWQQAFWYRGSAVPGAASTALIAGHINGNGRDAVFARIAELRKGAVIVVHDTRTKGDMHFVVTGSVAYTLAQTTTPAVLKAMYGSGPVAGKKPQPSADGFAHLTLVTCSGTFQSRIGTHDHRLAVFATRVA